MSENLFFHCGVQCVVRRTGASAPGEVLLGRRVNTSGEGTWSFPGGHVELDESPIETACRELSEETGLKGIGPQAGPMFITYSTEIPYAHVPVYFDDVEGTPEIIPDECFSELGYFDVENLPEPLFEPTSRVLKNSDEELLPIVPEGRIDLRRVLLSVKEHGEMQLVSTLFLHRLLVDEELRERFVRDCFPPTSGCEQPGPGALVPAKSCTTGN